MLGLTTTKLSKEKIMGDSKIGCKVGDVAYAVTDHSDVIEIEIISIDESGVSIWIGYKGARNGRNDDSSRS